MKTFNVYFLYNNLKTLLYVGKTVRLKTRLICHFSKTLLELEPWRNEVDLENIVTYQCNNGCDLDIYETYFINKYKPKYNKEKVFECNSTFDLPYLEPVLYSFKKSKAFQRNFIEYMDLREINIIANTELIEQYELEFPIFKEAYETLGRKVINSCKFNEKIIREKLYSKSSTSTDAVKELLGQTFKKGDQVSAKEIKDKLQNIYDTLNIKTKAKATDVSNYLNASVVNCKGTRMVYFK